MFLRKSLKLPIILAIVMIVLLIVLTVGWVWVTVAGALSDEHFSTFYWTVLPIGTSFLVLVLLGTIMYLTLSVKAINLTKRQSNFIDSVTHELKSPIASLKLYLQTLGLHDVTEAERTFFRRSMLEDVERLDLLINHLLDAGRLDRDQISESVEEAAVELADLLRECVHIVCVRYRVSPEIVSLELEPASIAVGRGDLEIIFRNLIDNAVKYAGNEPAVKVSLKSKGPDRVVVRVEDNGPGIPAPQRRKIFGRFVRVGLELERQKPGTGLGLFIVRNLVRRHRGEIRVLEAERGSGTVFEVLLPGRVVREEVEPGSQEASFSAGVSAS
jgi:signal transduction histidine kinase